MAWPNLQVTQRVLGRFLARCHLLFCQAYTLRDMGTQGITIGTNQLLSAIRGSTSDCERLLLSGCCGLRFGRGYRGAGRHQQGHTAG